MFLEEISRTYTGLDNILFYDYIYNNELIIIETCHKVKFSNYIKKYMLKQITHFKGNFLYLISKFLYSEHKYLDIFFKYIYEL